MFSLGSAFVKENTVTTFQNKQVQLQWTQSKIQDRVQSNQKLLHRYQHSKNRSVHKFILKIQ